MKHVFSVHSPITFLAAHAVVEHLNISIDQVIILTNNYSVPIEKYQTYPFYSNINSKWYQKLLIWNTPKHEDKYLDQMLNGSNFIAYIDIMSYHQRIIVTHPLCKGINFIEEGNVHYRDLDTMDDLTWDKRAKSFRINSITQYFSEVFSSLKWTIRGYNQRLLSIPYSFTSYTTFKGTKFFGFSQSSFPTVSSNRKEILTLRPTEDINKMAGNIKLNNDVVWIDGSNSKFTGLPESIYHYALEKAVVKLKTRLEGKKNYVKLRPKENDYSKNYLFQLLKRNELDVEVLPNNLIIECVFINSSDCLVIGNLSSALFYAAIYGHKAYSVYSLFEKQVPTYFDQMPGYWKVIKKM